MNIKKQWGFIMDILIDDIPDNLHAMVDAIGMENFLEVSKFYGGSNIYIPVHNKVVMGERNSEIAREYNGRNIDNLRLRYGISTQQIKKIFFIKCVCNEYFCRHDNVRHIYWGNIVCWL